MRQARLALTAMTAVAALAAAAAVAHAASFSLVGDDFRATWPAWAIEAGGFRISCPVTLEGSFTEATFAARAGARIGSVTGARTGTCSEGHATLLAETLPWSLQYESFRGTLPEITSLGLRLVGAAFQAETGLITCLARTEASQPGRLSATRESLAALTGLTLEEGAGIETSGGFFCSLAGAAHLSGSTSALTEPLEEEAAIEVYLEAVGTALVEQGETRLREVRIEGEPRTGQLTIADRSNNREAVFTSIEKFGGEREKFTIAKEGANCKDNTILPPRQACTTVISYAGGGLPASTSIRIQYKLKFHGISTTFTLEQSFAVNAR